MIISKDLQKYVVFLGSTIKETLEHMSANPQRIVFVLSEKGIVMGSVTDGDVRRWLTVADKIDLEVSIDDVMNHNVKTVPVDGDRASYQRLFVRGVECLPLVDEQYRLVQLAFKDFDGVVIAGREISSVSSAFIIAEIGNNHQGSIDTAKLLVDKAKEAGADCAKFQMRQMDTLYGRRSGDKAADLGAEYTLSLLDKFQLTNDELIAVFDYCQEQEIIPLCTPWDKVSLNILQNYGMAAYKVASADFTNHDLLESLAATGKPLICSTGMSSESEIRSGIDLLFRLGADFSLLHCNSTYPTPYKDVNLKYMNRLHSMSGKIVGYSGHERGISIPVAAVALGAKIIEKHITLDRSQEGTDHKVSLLPDEFKMMVSEIRAVEEGIGTESSERELTQGEMINRENLAKSIVAAKPIKKGDLITREMLVIQSPGQGVQPNRMQELVGKRAQRSLKTGDYFYDSDVDGGVSKRSDYRFSRPFGVPVRYHDYFNIIESTNLDFVEFHLSYKDMELDLSSVFDGEQSIGFAVHSPELFANDHIMDLASEDEIYRNQSIDYLRQVIDLTRRLKNYFPETKSPVVVLNVGGWTTQGFLSKSEKLIRYQRIADAIEDVDSDGVTLSIQTMPPFPWHFGGQSYHNLFVDPNEIVEFCQANTNIRVCLDISHTMMACNYYGWDFIQACESVAPFVSHLHIVDAKGVDGEGVELGKGDVNFVKLGRLLQQSMPDVSFIPEVWQGHKNSGEGFWKALEYLESVIQ